jgi:hypothetical protein
MATTDKFDLTEWRKLADEADAPHFMAEALRAACVALEERDSEIDRTKDRDWLAQLLAETREEMSGRVERMNEITRTLARENERLRTALQFYETWENYLGHFSVCVIARDKGKTARSALVKENPHAVIK